MIINNIDYEEYKEYILYIIWYDIYINSKKNYLS